MVRNIGLILERIIGREMTINIYQLLRFFSLTRIIVRILEVIVGTTIMQYIFEGLLNLSLIVMNYNPIEVYSNGERYVMKYIKKKLRGEKNLILFDVGGNVGYYTKDLADCFGSDATIHSFEPSKKTFESYLKNTAEISNIIPNNFGLSDIESKKTLYTDGTNSGIASVYERRLDFLDIYMDQSEEVELSTIDNYCRKNDIQRIHFLKMDIEGHELSALFGAEQMLNKQIDFIQFEFGGCNISSRTYFQDFFYLLNEKYRIYRVLRGGLRELKEYREIYEIFQTVNIFAVRK